MSGHSCKNVLELSFIAIMRWQFYANKRKKTPFQLQFTALLYSIPFVSFITSKMVNEKPKSNGTQKEPKCNLMEGVQHTCHFRARICGGSIVFGGLLICSRNLFDMFNTLAN